MGQQTIPVLKEKFADGKTPTGGDFGDVFDSYLHKGTKINQAQVLGLNEDFATKDELSKATTKFKGYHTTLAELNAEYPQAQNEKDFFAWVGSPYPGTVYKVYTDSGAWTDTGEVPTQEEIDLADYVKQASVQQEINDSAMPVSSVAVKQSVKTIENELIYGYSDSETTDITGVLTNGAYVKPSDGKLVTGADYQYSGFIPVSAGDIIIISGCFGYHPTDLNARAGIAGYSANSEVSFVANIFDASKAGISTQGRFKIENFKITIPVGVNYIRGGSAYKNSNGNELQLLIKQLGGSGDVVTLKTKVQEQDGNIETLKSELVYESKNDNTTNITGKLNDGGYIKVSDGLMIASADYHYSDFIPVSVGDIIIVSGCFGYNPNDPYYRAGVVGYSANSEASFVVDLFDASKAGFLENGRHKVENFEITIPAGVSYIRGSSAYKNANGNELPLSLFKVISDITGTLTTGGYIKAPDGKIISNVDYHYSDFISVSQGTKLKISGCFGYGATDPYYRAGIAGYSANSETSFVVNVFDASKAGYTENGRFKVENFEITIPAGVSYIRGSSAFQNSSGSERPLQIISLSGGTGKVVTLKEQLQEVTKKVDAFSSANALETKLRVMTYNIGHYSDAGGSPNSPITVSQYEQIKMKWRKLMYDVEADIIGLQEYSRVFCSGNGALSLDTIYKDLFKNYYEGVQRNYTCNAFFANYEVLSIELKEYECNKTAVISDGRPVKATDCYYLVADMVINGKELCVIITHLAFDLNNVQIELDQIDELITILDTKERVIVLGDFNVHHGASGFDAFVNAGYTIANNGYIGNIPTYPYPNVTKTLDNVVCSKNIKVKKVLADFVPMNTNDHIPFVADIVI